MNKYFVYSLVLLAFAGLFGWAYFVPEVNTKAAHTTTEEGFFDEYTYLITTFEKQKEKTASFSPAVEGNDGEVVPVLREVMRVAYDVRVSNELQPEVEALDETNYVTFKVDAKKIYFQLFKDEAGKVGSVSFWRQ